MSDKKWFVVHAYSGFEKSVQRALTERIKRSGMAEQFGKILVPVEEVVEMKNGAKAISERKFFPGYVLVEMEMTDDTWHLVKNTPKVTGFVGGTANKPTPITQKEVDAILRQVQEGVEKPRPKVLFEMGEAVRVKEGPFTAFHGNVEGGHGDPEPADRARARPARPEHHGVLQGVQRANAENGARIADSRGHHCVRGQELQLRDEDAARDGADSESGEGRKGQRQAAYRQGRQAYSRTGRGNREDEDARSHRRGSRCRRANDRGQRP